MSHLFSEFLSPVCAPQLLDKNSEFDWLDLPFIRLVGRRSGWSEWATRAGVEIPSGPMLRFDSFMVALEAAKAGAGVLLASLPLSQTALERKDVVRLSDVELSMNNSNWLVRKNHRFKTRCHRRHLPDLAVSGLNSGQTGVTSPPAPGIWPWFPLGAKHRRAACPQCLPYRESR